MRLRAERLNVLGLNFHVAVISQVGGQRGEAERREQGVLDRPPVGARRFRERRQDHLHLHRSASPKISTDRARSRGPSSSTKNTRCQRPSMRRPPVTLRQADGGISRARQWHDRSPALQRSVHPSFPTVVVLVPPIVRRNCLENRLEVRQQQRFVLVDHHGCGRVKRLNVQNAEAKAGVGDEPLKPLGQVNELCRLCGGELNAGDITTGRPGGVSL